MTFAIVTHVEHYLEKDVVSAYGPYVREMNIWMKHVDEVILVAPLSSQSPSKIQWSYAHPIQKILSIPAISIQSFSQLLRTIWLTPFIFWQLFKAMRKADHIHLRCPGNIGLLGCLVQLFFPKKPKTAKYAGNWDPNSKQPLSYRIQKWILSNTFLTRNMQVLVYGTWEGMTANIKPFFTATYPNSKVTGILKKNFEQPYKFVFVGTLSEGKQPLYAIKFIEKLIKENVKCELAIYGEGPQSESMKQYIAQNDLDKYILLHGNQPTEVIETAYRQSHFMLLPSRSEGWPKVVAESMFWGAIPLVPPVSCVPWMLDHGSRGILLTGTLEKDTRLIKEALLFAPRLKEMSEAAQSWSHQFTLDTFEEEIIKLLK
jgi:glycosyltransferase involved in cell wall biosynthesis